MKKLFTLIALLTCVVSGAWAETVNGTVSFTAQNRITNNGDGTFKAARNAGNQYALALADLSSVEKISNASTITITFNANISSKSRVYFGIGDKSSRSTTAGTSSKATYDTNGLIMRFGTGDGSTCLVNGANNNTNAFGVDLYVSLTLDRINGNYSYTIQDAATKSTTYFSGTNISTTVNNATIVEAYTWQNNCTITVSDVSYSFEYSAEQFNYTVTAVDNSDNILKEIASGVSNEAVTVYYPFAIKKDGVWYTKSTTSYAVEATSVNKDIKVVYTPNTSMVFFSEGEGGYANVWMADTNPEKYSSGNICNNNDGRTSGSALNAQNRGLTIGTLPAGNYRLYVMVVGKNKRGINLRSGSTKIATVDNSLATSGLKSIDFTLATETSNLLLNGNDNGSKSTQLEDIDYLYIESLTPASVPVNISAAGYATFVTPYAVDFTGNAIEAYAVSAVNANTVTLTKVNQVPADEAVIVKGESGNVNVIANATPISNLMQVAINNVIYDKNAEQTNYVLAQGANGVGLYPVTSGTIAAGKGYLPVDKAAGAAKNGFTFVTDDVTAVEVAEAAPAAVKNGKFATAEGIVIVKDGVKYNVAGMKK